jgi:cytochrome c-type protein NapB
MRTLLLALLSTLLVACATAKPVAIPANDLGLQKGPVLEAAVPPRLVVNGTSPGEAPLPTKSWPGVAPVVPHAIADFVPITPKENACMGCHDVPTKEKGGPTPIPGSHHVDFRNAPGKVSTKVVDTRYVCVSCHVESTGAKPLVGNAFAPKG